MLRPLPTLCLLFALSATAQTPSDTLSAPSDTPSASSDVLPAPCGIQPAPLVPDTLPPTAAVPLRQRIGIGAEAGWSGLLKMDDECRAIIRGRRTLRYALYGELRTLPADGNAYDGAFGYPTLRGGVMVADYTAIPLWRTAPRLGYDSGTGLVVALYGGFLRDVVRTRRWRLGYKMENGVGICTRPYRTATNADNELIGSRWNVYINLGLYARLLLTPRLEASLAAEYYHFSNSALDRPNKGANNAGLSLGLTYYPEPVQYTAPVRPVRRRFSGRGLYVEASAGWAGKTLLDEWVIHYWNEGPGDASYRTSHYTVHHALTALVAPMYRYGRRYASGLGLDYTYAKYASRLRDLDHQRGITRYSYSRHVVGLTLRHEVFYRHLSLTMGLGLYLHRRMGYTADADEKPYYETVGLRYSLPFTHDRLFLGYQVKAHLTKADCMQLTLGWRFGTKKH